MNIESYFLTITEAAMMMRCMSKDVEALISSGVFPLSRMPGHTRKRLVYRSDVKAYLDRKNDVPVTNLPPRKGHPNIIIVTPVIRRCLPVPLRPPCKYAVYVLRKPNGNPFYVGKGVESRPYNHLKEAKSRTCVCLKCKIIQQIWKLKKEPIITYEFGSDDEKAATQIEAKLIRELSKEFGLTNTTHNANPRTSKPLSKFIGIPASLPLSELNAYLDRWNIIDIHEHKRLIDKWAPERLLLLDDEWRSLRRRQHEEAAIIDSERDQLRAMIGQVYQYDMFSGTGDVVRNESYRKRRVRS